MTAKWHWAVPFSSAFMSAEHHRLKPANRRRRAISPRNGRVFPGAPGLVAMDPVAAVPHPCAVLPRPPPGDPARAGEGRTARDFVARSRCRAAHDNDSPGSPIRLTDHHSASARIHMGIIGIAMIAAGDYYAASRRRQATGEDRADGEGDREEDFHGEMFWVFGWKGERIIQMRAQESSGFLLIYFLILILLCLDGARLERDRDYD